MSGATGDIAVTGASGYIGSVLVRTLLEAGYGVRALVRRPGGTSHPRLRTFLFRNERPEKAAPALVGAVALVHLAWDTRQVAAEEADVEAVRRLCSLCSELGVRFVFVSSQSAAPDAPSHYGRAKFTAEQIVLAAGHTVVRPGLVYGEQERGLFGRLCGLVRSAPVLPRLWPDPPVQPVHVEDLCEAVARLLSQVRDGGRVYAIAGIEPLGFSAFLRAIAESWVRRPRPSLPVPSWLLRMVTGVPLGPAFAQMRSLYGLPALDARGSLDELGIVLRPLSEGLSMSKKQERRPLVREATAMLTYLLSRRPPLAATKRLMREFERSGTPFAPLLPPLLLRHPTLIGALDRPHAGPLRARLLIASCVAESSSIGYARFALITPVSRLYALIFLGRALGRVVLLTTLRPFVRLVAKAPAPVR